MPLEPAGAGRLAQLERASVVGEKALDSDDFSLHFQFKG
jgi:acyl-homoserine lactone acylase PvdQ